MSKQKEKIIEDNDVKKLVIKRLEVLKAVSPDTIISIGSEGGFTPKDLINHVEDETEIGELIAEMEMDWLHSFKEEQN